MCEKCEKQAIERRPALMQASALIVEALTIVEKAFEGVLPVISSQIMNADEQKFMDTSEAPKDIIDVDKQLRDSLNEARLLGIISGFMAARDYDKKHMLHNDTSVLAIRCTLMEKAMQMGVHESIAYSHAISPAEGQEVH